MINKFNTTLVRIRHFGCQKAWYDYRQARDPMWIIQIYRVVIISRCDFIFVTWKEYLAARIWLRLTQRFELPTKDDVEDAAGQTQQSLSILMQAPCWSAAILGLDGKAIRRK
jgi:hypothetical protein